MSLYRVSGNQAAKALFYRTVLIDRATLMAAMTTDVMRSRQGEDMSASGGCRMKLIPSYLNCIDIKTGRLK